METPRARPGALQQLSAKLQEYLRQKLVREAKCPLFILTWVVSCGGHCRRCLVPAPVVRQQEVMRSHTHLSQQAEEALPGTAPSSTLQEDAGPGKRWVASKHLLGQPLEHLPRACAFPFSLLAAFPAQEALCFKLALLSGYHPLK